MTDEPQEDEILDAIEDGEGVVVGQTFTDKEVSGAAFGHAEFEDVVDTTLAGAFRCARRASKGMIRLRRVRRHVRGLGAAIRAHVPIM